MGVEMRATILTCIITIILSIGGAYGVLKTTDTELSKDVGYMSETIHRLDTNHDTRININHKEISLLGEEVNNLKSIMPLILEGVQNIKQDTCSLKEGITKLEIQVGILNDRENRRTQHDDPL